MYTLSYSGDVFTNTYVPFSSHNYARHLQAQEEEHARQVQNRRELARAQHQEVRRMQEEARRLEKQQKKEKKKDCIIMWSPLSLGFSFYLLAPSPIVVSGQGRRPLFKWWELYLPSYHCESPSNNANNMVIFEILI